MRERGLVYGVGINDDPTSVKILAKDPIYTRWQGMIMRCYSEKFKESRPTYEHATVCEEWKIYSNFRDWCKLQNHEGKHMDKDLLVKGNTVYSPDTVCFIPPELNAFFTDRKRFTSASVGVRRVDSGKYVARIMNPFTGVREQLGTFLSLSVASEAWRKRKHELANQWADIIEKEGYGARLVEALRKRYRPLN